MLDLGTVRPGSTIYIPVNTFDSNDPSASVTATNWVNTDCHVHKNGGTTQRASSAGETLSIDFDTITGNHILAIDLSDDTTSDFYEAGATYQVRIEGVTVDGATINAWIGQWRIGYPGALLDTTIATLASQTGFTLDAGAADNDAYNGWVALIHDKASAVQLAIGYVSDYVGSTKTVTLAADPGIFTMAAGDNISLFPPAQVASWNNVPLATTNPLPNAAADAAGGLIVSDAGGLDADAQAASVAAIETDTSTTLDNLVDDLETRLGTPSDLGSGATVAGNLVDMAGATFSTATDSQEAIRNHIGDGTNLTEAGGTGDHLTALATAAALATVDGNVDAILVDTGTTLQAELDGIQADTEDIQSRLGSPSDFGSGTSTIAANLQDIADNGTAAFDRSTDSLQAIRDHIADGTNLTEAGGTGDHLTAVPWNAAWDAEVQSEVTDALNAYDPPTNAEMEARTLTAAQIAQLGQNVDNCYSGTASADTHTTTTMISDIAIAADDQFNGRTIIFDDDTTTANLRGVSTDITDCTASNDEFTFTAIPTAPQSGDTFVIV